MTGHLDISTLHAGTAPGVFGRLLEMGLEPAAVTSVLRLAVAQRLVRRLCSACAGTGCGACLGSGFRGRVPVAEALPLGSELRAAVLAGGDLAALRAAAARGGMVGLLERGAELVRRGLAAAAEVERALAGVGGA
jgi:general secretion pathway protein E